MRAEPTTRWAAPESGSTLCTCATASRRELPLDVVHPLEMRFEKPPGKPEVQPQILPPVRQRLGDRFRVVKARGQLSDLDAQGRDALAHRPFADEIGGEDACDPFVVHARKRGRPCSPLAQGGEPLLRQRVVRPFARLARLLARAEIAEALQPLRLRVLLAGRAVGVDAAPVRHPDEVVRAGAAPSDKGKDPVRECRELSP
jgi:hypothetical protein